MSKGGRKGSLGTGALGSKTRAPPHVSGARNRRVNRCGCVCAVLPGAAAGGKSSACSAPRYEMLVSGWGGGEGGCECNNARVRRACAACADMLEREGGREGRHTQMKSVLYLVCCVCAAVLRFFLGGEEEAFGRGPSRGGRRALTTPSLPLLLLLPPSPPNIHAGCCCCSNSGPGAPQQQLCPRARVRPVLVV